MTPSIIDVLAMSGCVSLIGMLFSTKKKHESSKWRPEIVASESSRIRRLGSDYGGWFFVHDESLHGSTIISAGLGEDASFDFEFANWYSAKVLMVDPTPRAIEHFKRFHREISSPKSLDYVNGGQQPIQSYDSQFLHKDSFTLEPSALWNRSKRLDFFAPPNINHVSHSLVDYQNDYKKNGKKITVEAITYTKLLRKHPMFDSPKILKLDIEGAEIETIRHLLARGHRPSQILVEYDELSTNSEIASRRALRTHQLLKKNGYSCVFEDKNNFTYLLDSSLDRK